MKNILAIIPARGGSKGIPKKNIVDIAGKPMIAYSIGAAKASKYVNKVVVSTDDKEIADISKKYGAEIIDRPKEMATDTAPVIQALKHAVEEVKKQGYKPELIVLLQVTSPLRTAEDIDAAVKKCIDNYPCSVVSLTEVPHGLHIMYALEGEKIKSVIEKKKEKLRQEIEKVYKLNGSIYVFDEKLLSKGKVYEEGTLAYILPKERSVDIDDKSDLELARILLKK